jgi:hypothetical protein
LVGWLVGWLMEILHSYASWDIHKPVFDGLWLVAGRLVDRPSPKLCPSTTIQHDPQHLHNALDTSDT